MAEKMQSGDRRPHQGPAEPARNTVHLELQGLRAGYGKMEVIHGIDLRVEQGQSVCLVGPNGAGKSTVLNAIFGLIDIFDGRIIVAGNDVTGWSAETMLTKASMAYVLQTNSVFSDMSVEENLFVGAHTLPSRRQATEAVEQIFETYPNLAERRHAAAGALSGGERRMLELARALMTEPDILLVDEPSIGLEPRAIDDVFAMLSRLQRTRGKTVVIVEQNVKKGLEFADIGYVLVSGRIALVDRAASLLQNPQIATLFLGG
jgi:branched-chain amino acid transport system ATP-binding protein